MEELTKRNIKRIWLREIEKVLKRVGASREWFMERVRIRDEEMDAIEENREMEAHDKVQLLRAKRMRSIEEVLEEVGVLINTQFFNEFTGTKSSTFLKKEITHQNVIEMKHDVPKHENRVTFSYVAVLSLAERPATAEKVTR